MCAKTISAEAKRIASRTGLDNAMDANQCLCAGLKARPSGVLVKVRLLLLKIELI